MELDVLFWIGGMIFSLGIFAVKTGLGFGFGGVTWRSMAMILPLYLILFVLLALASQTVLSRLTPVLQKGPWLHLSMAAGLIGWGVYLIWRDGGCRHCGKRKETSSKSFLLLAIPCPVCLAAMAFSTAMALNAIPWHPAWVGVVVGGVFALLVLPTYFSVKFFARELPPAERELRLGLAMIFVGLYFIASLFLPGYIEQAKLAYGSFAGEVSHAPRQDMWGVLGLLAACLFAGFFIPQFDQKGAFK
ncbi:MAG: DUF2162 domain-containing protein [Verrucomicrobiae bacterium]|nr:DUF2162 domain-containing protein [Verrucomicrobiae bacterium]